MLTYLLIQWRHIVTMSHNTFHSSRVIDKRQRRRLANVDIRLRHLVTIRSHNSFHSGHLAITVTLRGPDGDRYGQVLLYFVLVNFFLSIYSSCFQNFAIGKNAVNNLINKMIWLKRLTLSGNITNTGDGARGPVSAEGVSRGVRCRRHPGRSPPQARYEYKYLYFKKIQTKVEIKH